VLLGVIIASLLAGFGYLTLHAADPTPAVVLVPLALGLAFLVSRATASFAIGEHVSVRNGLGLERLRLTGQPFTVERSADAQYLPRFSRFLNPVLRGYGAPVLRIGDEHRTCVVPDTYGWNAEAYAALFAWGEHHAMTRGAGITADDARADGRTQIGIIVAVLVFLAMAAFVAYLGGR